MKSLSRRPGVFVEPFAGGAIIGLTVAAENLADRVILGELDDGVAAVWETIFSADVDWLVNRIMSMKISREAVLAVLSETPRSTRDLAFQTLLRNRVQRGGILAPGASIVKNGENGKGVASRWYPQTLAKRIGAIADMKDRMTFIRGDAFVLIRQFLKRSSAAFFIDPPYTAGGKRAGSRLYKHNELDHERLFDMMSRANGPAMMTYDESAEVRTLAERYGLRVEFVPMKNTHHEVLRELVITNSGLCLPADQMNLFSAV